MPSVTASADIVVAFLSAGNLSQLEATATESPTQWRWEVLSAPTGSTYASTVRGDFTNGVATLQNPQFVTDVGLAGTYVFQVTAKNASGWSQPSSDRENGQQNIIVTTSLEALSLPGSGQYNWGNYNNTNFTILEQRVNAIDLGLGGIITDHGSLIGLDHDDHVHYHNDTRGDARYYTKSEHINTSTGISDAGKPIKLDASGVIDSSMIASTSIHALGSATHSADTLSNLNTLISDATLIDTGDSRLSDARTPTAHNLGGAEHTADTLANLNTKISDATLIDTTDSRLSDDRNDADAVHFSVSDEFASTVAQKSTLDGTEQILIETNTGDAWDKRYIAASGISNLVQINTLEVKESASDSDLILIEDSENANLRMALTVSGLVSHWWKTNTFPFSYWTDLRFPTHGINPPGAASDPTRNNSTAFLEFSSSAINVIAGVAQLPHGWKEGSAIRPHIHHRASTNPSGTGDVVWKLQYKWYNNNETVPDSYSEDQKIFTLSDFSGGLAIADVHSFTEIDGTGMRDSSIFEWRVARIGDDGSDSYGDVDVLLEFDIHILMNSFGSLEEFPGA